MTIEMIKTASRSDLSGVEQHVVDVTPEIAKSLLEGNAQNRKLSEVRVSRYAADMANGDWPYTGDPIHITADGKLLNGQHRLNAVIVAGVTLPMLVITGVPADYQRFMDNPRLRTVGDDVHMMGLPNATIVASTARLLLTITKWPKSEDEEWDRIVRVGAYAAKSTSISKPVAVRFVEEHTDLVHSAEWGGRARTGCMAPPTVLSFIHYAATRIDAAKADEFLTRLHTGAGLEMGNPIHAARETINRARRESEQRDGATALFLLIAAWNHWREGNPVTRVISPKGGIVSSTTITMK